MPTAVRWSVSDPGLSVNEDVAYWRDHVFLAHVWRVLGISGISVEIRFGHSLNPNGLERRLLVQEVHNQVVGLFHSSPNPE